MDRRADRSELKLYRRQAQLLDAASTHGTAITHKGGRLAIPLRINPVERVLEHRRRTVVVFWRDEDKAVRPGDFGSPLLDHFILVSRATRHGGRHGLVEEGHWKVPEIEQPRVDAVPVLELLKNPLCRFFGKATLAGAPYDHRNDGHVSLLSGGLKFSRVSNEESPRTPLRRRRRPVIAPRPAQEGTNLIPKHRKVAELHR